MKLTVNLVTWNGSKYIPYLFDSLKKQSFKDWKLQVWDNNSEDDTLKLIENEASNLGVQTKIYESKDNSGFSGGHNKLYKKTNTDYFAIINQDIYLPSNCIHNMVKYLDDHPHITAVAPRLLKWNFNKVASDPDNNKKSGLHKSFSLKIDSLGLKVRRNRQVVDQLSGEIWSNQSKNKMIAKLRSLNNIEVFGLSGALVFYRKSDIENIVYENAKLFDESYKSYKEDVDLAYRLRISGRQSVMLLSSVAFHDRTCERFLNDNRISNHRRKAKQSFFVKYYSYKNHLATLYKNEYWQNFILDFPWILWYELQKFMYYLFIDRRVLLGLKDLFNSMDFLKKRRSAVNKMKKSNWRELRRWWM
ncbi:MAG: glycosyltransferase [Candidatus Magasanikbacteria bacterium]|nr:glycosyltransferase [Candidatus Magasanikbacteria bacterium]